MLRLESSILLLCASTSLINFFYLAVIIFIRIIFVLFFFFFFTPSLSDIESIFDLNMTLCACVPPETFLSLSLSLAASFDCHCVYLWFGCEQWRANYSYKFIYENRNKLQILIARNSMTEKRNQNLNQCWIGIYVIFSRCLRLMMSMDIALFFCSVPPHQHFTC